MQGYDFVFDPETQDFVKRLRLHNELGEVVTEMKTTTFDIW